MIVSYEKLHTAKIISEEVFIPLGNGIEVLIPPGAQNGDSWEVCVTPFTSPKPLAAAHLSDQTFLSNDEFLLSTINRNLVITNNDPAGVVSFLSKPDKSVPNFSSHKLTQFFNHIFLLIGRTLYWTDLDSYLAWYPDTINEADFRELEGETDNATALIRVNDILFIHFPQTIYIVEYTGKPTVVRILARSHGVGALSQHVIQAHQSAQYFLAIDNFYLYTPESGPKAIGQEIWKNFHRDTPNLSDVWSYLDLINNEVCWVTGDYLYAFNYLEGHWTRYSNEGLLAHTSTPWLRRHFDITHSPAESFSIVENNQITGLENLWLAGSTVCRELRENEIGGSVFGMRAPFLESDDISFGDIFNVKSVNAITFDASYDECYDGVRVLVSARNFVTEKVVWVDVGVWRSEDPLNRLTFKTQSGRILKFRFEMVIRENVSDGSRRFNGGQVAAGVFREVSDGSMRFDGKKKFVGKDVKRWDGKSDFGGKREFSYGYFELNAWGENIDPPSKLGPDK